METTMHFFGFLFWIALFWLAFRVYRRWRYCSPAGPRGYGRFGGWYDSSEFSAPKQRVSAPEPVARFWRRHSLLRCGELARVIPPAKSPEAARPCRRAVSPATVHSEGQPEERDPEKKSEE